MAVHHQKTTPAAIAANARHTEWIRLRSQGLTYPNIAAMFDVSKQAVWEAVRRHMTEHPAAAVDELREIQGDQLQTDLGNLSVVLMDYRTVYDEAKDQKEKDRAVKMILEIQDRRLRIHERFSRLNGLDKPIGLALFTNGADDFGVEPIDIYEASLNALAPPDMSTDE